MCSHCQHPGCLWKHLPGSEMPPSCHGVVSEMKMLLSLNIQIYSDFEFCLPKYFEYHGWAVVGSEPNLLADLMDRGWYRESSRVGKCSISTRYSKEFNQNQWNQPKTAYTNEFITLFWTPASQFWKGSQVFLRLQIFLRIYNLYPSIPSTKVCRQLSVKLKWLDPSS